MDQFKLLLSRLSLAQKVIIVLGAIIAIQHHEAEADGADVVVYSSAITLDHPALARARALGTAVIPRAEMLAELLRLSYAVLVAGSHGKTTVTSMIADLLTRGGLDPTVVIGGRLGRMGVQVARWTRCRHGRNRRQHAAA